MSNWTIRRENNDPLALRLSIGSPHGSTNGYIVYRGDTAECLELLSNAVTELENFIKEQGE